MDNISSPVPKGKKEIVHQDPYYILSRREGEKTASRRLRSAAELEQARKNGAEYKRFFGLCQELERLTARLGELKRGERGLEQENKTVQIAIEQDGEIRRILNKVAVSKKADLEAWETALRVAVLSAEAKVLDQLLQGIGSGRESPGRCLQLWCPDGESRIDA